MSSLLTTESLESNAISELTKKQRGRQKKLRKAAHEEKSGCETTGISSLSDWREFVEYNRSASLTAQPMVRLRRHRLDRQNAEGEHHRDILYQILCRTDQTKKRSRLEIRNGIPAWATLHNVVAIESLVVIEMQFNAPKEPNWESLFERLTSLHNVSGVLPVSTRWFQGANPKSISDTLLYMSSPSHHKSSKRLKLKVGNNGSTCPPPFASLFHSMLLTTSERRKEGYPMDQPIRDAIEPKPQPQLEAKLLSREQAKHIVNHLRVPAMLREVLSKLAFVKTYREAIDKESRVFALDCEMVQTLTGSELARVTLIQLVDIKEDGSIAHAVVLDELVKPYQPVLDYVTKYSGITAAMLDPIETRIEQIQAFLVQKLKKDDIIVGHSVHNDLQAVQLIHDCVVDTAQVFRGKKGRKYALKHLAAVLLKRTIQDEHSGHCSEEDAVASLELAVQRALKGPCFGIIETDDSRVHLLECLVCDKDHPVVCIGPANWLNTHVTRFSTGAHALTCESVEDNTRNAVTSWVSNPKKRAKLLWANFHIEDDAEGPLDQANQLIVDVKERALQGTLVLIVLQQGLNRALRLTAARDARKNPRASLRWTDDEERIWLDTLDTARTGQAFWLSCVASKV